MVAPNQGRPAHRIPGVSHGNSDSVFLSPPGSALPTQNNDHTHTAMTATSTPETLARGSETVLSRHSVHCVSRSTVLKEILCAQCLLHGGGRGSSAGEGTCRCRCPAPRVPSTPEIHVAEHIPKATERPLQEPSVTSHGAWPQFTSVSIETSLIGRWDSVKGLKNLSLSKKTEKSV